MKAKNPLLAVYKWIHSNNISLFFNIQKPRIVWRRGKCDKKVRTCSPVTKTLSHFVILLLTSEESPSVVINRVSCAGLTYKFGYALWNLREKFWTCPYNVSSGTYCKAECQIFVLLCELAQAKREMVPLVPEDTASCCCKWMQDICFSWAPSTHSTFLSTLESALWDLYW